MRELLARGVLLPLYRAQRSLRPSRRAAMRHARDGRDFRSAASGWSDTRKRDWILAQLRAVVRRAYRDTSFYRASLDGAGFDPARDFSFADFARLPVLERDAIQAAGRGLLSRRIAGETLRRDATGGSTGTPTEIWMGP